MKRVNQIITIITLFILASCSSDMGDIEQLFENKKYEQTIDKLNTYLFFHVTDVKALHIRARSYEELGLIKEATQDYNRIINLSPEYA